MTELSFVPPSAPWSINAERTKHWSWRAKQVKWWRSAAAGAAWVANAGPQPPSTVHVSLPFDRAARRDPSNYLPPVKALIDGLVDPGGLWPDDTPEYVAVAEPELVVGSDLVVVRIVPRAEAAEQPAQGWVYECSLCRHEVHSPRRRKPPECPNCGGVQFRAGRRT
jgi:hypothetical protein